MHRVPTREPTTPIEPVIHGNLHELTHGALRATRRAGRAQGIPLNVDVECRAPGVITQRRSTPAHETRDPRTSPRENETGLPCPRPGPEEFLQLPLCAPVEVNPPGRSEERRVGKEDGAWCS